MTMNAQQDQTVISFTNAADHSFCGHSDHRTHSARDHAAALSDNEVMAKREKFAREYAIMKAHLNEVGIDRFADEQMKMDKIFKALAIVKGEHSALGLHIKAMQQYFDHYTPRSSDDMHEFISGYVQGASNTNPSHALRLRKMHNRIQQLLSMPDTMLDTLGRRGSSPGA